MAYVSDESGRNNVYAIAASARATNHGLDWGRPDERAGAGAGPVGAWRAAKAAGIDVSPDSQRFLLIWTEVQSRPTRLDVVLNWFAELTRTVEAR